MRCKEHACYSCWEVLGVGNVRKFVRIALTWRGGGVLSDTLDLFIAFSVVSVTFFLRIIDLIEGNSFHALRWSFQLILSWQKFLSWVSLRLSAAKTREGERLCQIASGENLLLKSWPTFYWVVMHAILIQRDRFQCRYTQLVGLLFSAWYFGQYQLYFSSDIDCS